MHILKNFLERYAHIEPPEAVRKDAFITAVKKVLEISIQPEQLSIHKNTVKLNVPSVMKTEIRLHQQDILKCVADEVGDKYTLTSIL